MGTSTSLERGVAYRVDCSHEDIATRQAQGKTKHRKEYELGCTNPLPALKHAS